MARYVCQICRWCIFAFSQQIVLWQVRWTFEQSPSGPAFYTWRRTGRFSPIHEWDVKVIRTTNGMATSIYRKPTITWLYRPWDSYSPTLYKVNLERLLCHRALRICSPAYLPAELQALRSILLNNGYPGHVLDKHKTPLPRSNVSAFKFGLDPFQSFSSFPGSATKVNSSIRRRTQLFVLRTFLLKLGLSSKHRRCSPLLDSHA